MVTPSVNMTITFALVLAGSNSASALVNASAWLVEPPALNASTAALRSATEVINPVSCTAVSAKLTIPIRLPLPICPSCAPSVASSMMSMNTLAASFRLGRLCAILPERSRISTISVGFVVMSGAAVSASVTLNVLPQGMAVTFVTFVELVIPIAFRPFRPPNSRALSII